MILNSSEKNSTETPYVSLEEIFLQIIDLSYMGELRTYIKAESADKKHKILAGSKSRIIDLYYKPITDFVDKHNFSIIDNQNSNLTRENLLESLKQGNLSNYLIKRPVVKNTNNSSVLKD